MNGRVLLALIAAATARAEPRVMLLVDTSASMLWSACGGTDVVEGLGTDECPGVDVPCDECSAEGCGDGVADDSRLAMMKAAIGSFVEGCAGTRFGLARFHQEPTGFVCPSGGWVGTSVACGETGFASDPGEGFNRADILVEPGDLEALRVWMDLGANQEGTPGSSGCELCGDCGGGCDQELRASGGTPIAGSLRTLRSYFLHKILGDGRGGPYSVFLFSDGIDNCPGDAVAEAGALCEAGIGVQTVGFSGDCPLGCDDPCFFDCEGGTCPGQCTDRSGVATEECARDCAPGCLAACQRRPIAEAGCGPGCRDSGCTPEALGVEDGAALAAALQRACPAAGPSGCGCALGARQGPGALVMLLVLGGVVACVSRRRR
jgi:hypothetical protein